MKATRATPTKQPTTNKAQDSLRGKTVEEIFDSTDDQEILQGILDVARQFRRKGDSRAATTAAKIELLFTRAITAAAA